MCNVSNQAGSKEEDAINRPWRPLPSERITEENAVLLRRAVVVACLALSSLYGPDVVLASAGLILTTFVYDSMGLAAHPIGKNFCNIWGYTMFQTGATKLMGEQHSTRIQHKAAVLSATLQDPRLNWIIRPLSRSY